MSAAIRSLRLLLGLRLRRAHRSPLLFRRITFTSASWYVSLYLDGLKSPERRSIRSTARSS